MKTTMWWAMAVVCAVLSLPLAISQEPRDRKQGERKGRGEQSKAIVRGLPAALAGKEYTWGKIVLGRATNESITLSILMDKEGEGYCQYGTRSGVYPHRSATTQFKADKPTLVVLGKLQAATQYFYRLCYRQPPMQDFQPGSEFTFHTQRQTNERFVFVVQADPHGRDANVNFALYERTLQNEQADAPDFLVDLGDTFMSDKFAADRDTVFQLHAEQRPYFGLVCHSAPLYLVLGNHEGESGWLLKRGADNLAVWAAQARTMYYPNPLPDNFYSGDQNDAEFVGRRGNYYAWKWGNALFVVLDPYWYTSKKPKRDNGDNWQWTLGAAQYQWLCTTLQSSREKFKFVFAHQLVGGVDANGRGGTEGAGYYEWGGKNKDGSWGFASKRPSWGKTIHQLLVDHQVTIFFHGHDHLFAQQEMDGVVYQEVPQPSHSGRSKEDLGKEYGYLQGKVLNSPGHLRVTVGSNKVTVDYVQSAVKEEKRGVTNGQIAHSYTINSPGK